MSRKVRVGIDVNEVLRARWLQFDRFYSQEFGDEGIPKTEPYVYDFFKHYAWKDTVEIVKELKEPEDMPEHINPIEYQPDATDGGKAPADAFLFKKPEEIKLTAKEMYNRFMYQDYLFEIFGSAPMMYRNMDLHVNNFLEKYQECADFTVISIENKFSIPPTLFFLSKITSRFKKYQFVDNSIDMWEHVDVLITTDPEILKGGAPFGKKLIKLNRPYNQNIPVGVLKKQEILQIADLIDNQEFEKIIKYKK
jgi:hypothetical protein